MLDEGPPIALQKVPPLDFSSQAVDLELLPQKRLFVEEVPPNENERLAMCQSLAHAPIPNLAQDAVGCIDLQSMSPRFAHHLRSINPASSEPTGTYGL